VTKAQAGGGSVVGVWWECVQYCGTMKELGVILTFAKFLSAVLYVC